MKICDRGKSNKNARKRSRNDGKQTKKKYSYHSEWLMNFVLCVNQKFILKEIFILEKNKIFFHHKINIKRTFHFRRLFLKEIFIFCGFLSVFTRRPENINLLEGDFRFLFFFFFYFPVPLFDFYLNTYLIEIILIWNLILFFRSWLNCIMKRKVNCKEDFLINFFSLGNGT